MSCARDFKSPVVIYKTINLQNVYKRNIPVTNFLKASITRDSMKIFSITFCTLATVYCVCKIAKDAFRIVL